MEQGLENKKENSFQSRLEELQAKENSSREERAELEGLMVWGEQYPRAAELWTKRLLGKASDQETAELLGWAEGYDNPELADLIRRGALDQLSEEEKEKAAAMIRKRTFGEEEMRGYPKFEQ